MTKVKIALLRGVCQMPAYVAHEAGFFREQGVETSVDVAPTAWTIPERLVRGDCQFAVIPWTRVAAADARGEPLVLVCGSGREEAAIVVRKGLRVSRVRRVAVPQEGGMKDLTAMGMLKSLGWEQAERIRQPSGDGAILALVGQGADAASMIEPYATMMGELGIGRVVRRTGDLWPGAPGCSLTTTRQMIRKHPRTVQAVVNAFVRGIRFTARHPAEAAAMGCRYIGVNERFLRESLQRNLPDADTLRSRKAISQVLALMKRLGYLRRAPGRFIELKFLDEAQQAPARD
jgi:NitT/TauT family transport system substrate-binding protein